VSAPAAPAHERVPWSAAFGHRAFRLFQAIWAWRFPALRRTDRLNDAHAAGALE